MRATLTTAKGDQTAQTRVFDIVRNAGGPTIYPGRALRNGFFERWYGHENELESNHAQASAEQLATGPDDYSQRMVWLAKPLT